MSSILKITAMGFWFPVGSPNFFRASDEYSPDNPLIKHINSTVALTKESSKEPRGEDHEAKKSGKKKRVEDLQASVYRRLISVAPYKGYTQVIPVFPRVRLTFGDVENEPVMAILTRDAFEQKWPTSMKALVMIVHSRGFYLWLAVHDKIDEIDREAVRNVLEEHIYDIVGGDFRSRRANPPEQDTNSAAAVPLLGDNRTLQDYRDNHLGILSFFQINAIFEALNNSAFTPALFFERLQREQPQIEEREDKYSLGEFIRSITTLTAVGDDDELPDEVKQRVVANQRNRVLTTAEIADKLLKLTASTSSVKEKREIADQLRDDCLTSTVQHDLLRQFMRITAANALRVMKSRIERCSRVLLSGMLEITHRRQPLIQTEAPDYDDSINGVSDEQLHTFIMYIASKMPLIKNIERSLNEALDRDDINRDSINRDSANGDNIDRDSINGVLFENLEALHSGWIQMVHGIDDDLQGLELASAQVRQDQLLREEQRIRTEQETLTELNRLQEGSRQRSLEQNDQTVSLVSNVVALIAVILSVLYLFQTSSIQLDSFAWPPNSQTITVMSVVAVLVLLGILFSVIFHVVASWVLSVIEKRRAAKEQRSDRYYYEVDVQLDVPIEGDEAKKLLDVDNRPKTWWQKVNEGWIVRHDQGQVPYAQSTHRNSYRGERVSRDETIHKVYIATDIRWDKGRRVNPLRWHWWPKRSHDMRLFLIYEIQFHRHSDAPRFLLQSLRAVSPHGTVLTTEQLTELKRLIINTFINPYISNNQDRLVLGDKNSHIDALKNSHIDALMTLNVIPEE